MVIEGEAVAYPSPQRLVDVILRHPDFGAWVETRDLAGDWNMIVDGPYLADEVSDGLDAHGSARPQERITVSMFAGGSTPGDWAEVVIDPWTAEVDRAVFEADSASSGG